MSNKIQKKNLSMMSDALRVVWFSQLNEFGELIGLLRRFCHYTQSRQDKILYMLEINS